MRRNESAIAIAAYGLASTSGLQVLKIPLVSKYPWYDHKVTKCPEKWQTLILEHRHELADIGSQAERE